MANEGALQQGARREPITQEQFVELSALVRRIEGYPVTSAEVTQLIERLGEVQKKLAEKEEKRRRPRIKQPRQHVHEMKM